MKKLSQSQRDLNLGKLSRRDFNKFLFNLSLATGVSLSFLDKLSAWTGTRMRKAIKESGDFNVSNLSYNSTNYLVTEDTRPRDLFIKPDGTKLYLTGDTGNRVYQYSLGTAWDLSTISYDTITFATGAAKPYCTEFKPDGTTLFFTDYDTDTIRQFDMSTAWDLSTAVHQANNLKVNGVQTDSAAGFFVNPVGDRMFVVDSIGGQIQRWNLSTNWSLTGATASTTFSTSTQDANPQDVSFTSDGLTMLVSGLASAAVYQYTLASPWDISSVTYNSVSLDVSSEGTVPFGLFLRPDNSKLYVLDSGVDTISEYI